jgi:hypothetical protein
VSRDVPQIKFYTSKAFEFFRLGFKFDQNKFLEHLTLSYDLNKIYDDSDQNPEDTFLYKLKLHIAKKRFPIDFKQALDSIFDFLDKLTALNNFDKDFKFQILDSLFADHLEPTTFNEEKHAEFNLASTPFNQFYLDKKMADLNFSNASKFIVVKEFLRDMRSNPHLYQPHEYRLAKRIFMFYDDRSHALEELYKLFELIRPKEFNELLSDSLKTTKIFDRHYYLPKNNFYNWMKLYGDDPSRVISDHYKPNTLIIPASSNSVFLDIHLNPCSSKPLDCDSYEVNNTYTYYVMKRPIIYPRDYSVKSFQERLEFIYATCLGIIYRGQFYENPQAVEINN